MQREDESTQLGLSSKEICALGRELGKEVLLLGVLHHLWTVILMTVSMFAEKYWQPDEPDRRTLGQGGASNGVER